MFTIEQRSRVKDNTPIEVRIADQTEKNKLYPLAIALSKEAIPSKAIKQELTVLLKQHAELTPGLFNMRVKSMLERARKLQKMQKEEREKQLTLRARIATRKRVLLNLSKELPQEQREELGNVLELLKNKLVDGEDFLKFSDKYFAYARQGSEKKDRLQKVAKSQCAELQRVSKSLRERAQKEVEELVRKLDSGTYSDPINFLQESEPYLVQATLSNANKTQ